MPSPAPSRTGDGACNMNEMLPWIEAASYRPMPIHSSPTGRCQQPQLVALGVSRSEPDGLCRRRMALSQPILLCQPGNSERALFRYVAHADLDLYRNRVVLFVDGNFFTDRSASNVLRPSEFDLVMGLAVRYHEMEIALIHERDLPLDRGGLVQRYVALQLRYESNGPDRRVLQANNSHSIARPLSALSPAARAMLRCPTCRMLKKSASGVLASFRASTYPKGTPRLFTRCGLAGRPFSASCGNVRLLCTRADYRISRVSI